jgi:tetratricopeptide (TPR) repeat protein
MNGELEVQLFNDSNVPIATLRTYTETQFTFRGLPSGTYYVEVNATGYKAVRQRVDLVAGQYDNNVPITLEAEAPAAAYIQPSELSDDDVVDISDLARSPEVLKKFQEATKKFNTGDMNGARSRLESLLTTAPNFYEAHKVLGAVYQRSHRYREAEREYLLARGLRPLSPVPLIHLGSLYLEEVESGTNLKTPPQDSLEKARDLLLKAIGLNSNAGFARYLLGVTYYKLGKYSDSESTLIRALELEPNLGDIRLALANVYMRVQDWPKALLSLDRYLKENLKAANRENILAKRQQVERIANGTK